MFYSGLVHELINSPSSFISYHTLAIVNLVLIGLYNLWKPDLWSTWDQTCIFSITLASDGLYPL